jgi:hypothetical protein
MNLIEFIGFILVFIAMVFLSLKRSWEQHQRRKHSEKFTEEEEEEELFLPPPPPEEYAVVHTPDEFELQMIEERRAMTGLQRKLFHSPSEKAAYMQRSRRAELSWLLDRDLKEAFLLKEILGKPRGISPF